MAIETSKQRKNISCLCIHVLVGTIYAIIEDNDWNIIFLKNNNYSISVDGFRYNNYTKKKIKRIPKLIYDEIKSQLNLTSFIFYK